jgi:CSLREA domain-containing protein
MKARALHLFFIATLIAGLALTVQPVPMAYAAWPINVNTTDDEINADGDCSLREAIQAANTNTSVDHCATGNPAPTVDVINVPAGTYITSVTLTITDFVTINGAGAGATIIDGGNAVRVFEVNAAQTVTISNVTVQNGNTETGIGGGIENSGTLTVTNSTVRSNSGGIANQGTLTVTNSTISDNSNSGLYNSIGGTLTVNGSTISGNTARTGGGIMNHGALTVVNGSTISGNTAPQGGGINNDGTLTVNGSTISGNSASKEGGGIYNAHESTLTVTNSTVSGNTADYVGGGIFSGGTLTVESSTISGNSATTGEGGGIANYGTPEGIITNSTISGNTAPQGGGIGNAIGSTLELTNSTVRDNFGGGINNGGTLTVNGSTISGNSADEWGGGIYNSVGGTLTVTNSTISGNTVNLYGGGIVNFDTLTVESSTITDNSAGQEGGGIWNSCAGGGTATLRNTIVADQADGEDCFLFSGSITSDGYNLDSDGTCELTETTDQPNTDPRLRSLADNGGPTRTHALRDNSPAIDTSDPYCPTTDQRGYPRNDGACDTGAFEHGASAGPPPPPPPPTPGIPINGKDIYKLKFKWHKAVGAAEYQIQVDDNADFLSPELDTAGLKTKYKPANMLPFGDYYWRVRAWNAAGNWGEWSDVWGFRYTILKKPSEDYSTTKTILKFSWQKVTGALEYQIQVDDDEDFLNPEVDATGLSNSYQPVDPFAPGTYHWRVRVRTAGGWEDWTPGWAFTIVAP